MIISVYPEPILPRNACMPKTNSTTARVWRHPVHFLAFGLGAGLMPVAPGTFGTLVALPLYLYLQQLSNGGYLLWVILLFLVGIGLCAKTARDLQTPDHSGIVWDEIVGYLVTMFMAPTGWVWMLLGFLWFRLFDIWKPFPIRWLDRHVHGGLGIMLDDVAAGLAAALALQGSYWVWTQNF
jgi:phosphatidylglycerophosphatase A